MTRPRMNAFVSRPLASSASLVTVYQTVARPVALPHAAIAGMMEMIRADLSSLNITHEIFFSERSLTQGGDKIAAAIDSLRRAGLVYVGRLPAPKGQPAAQRDSMA